GSTGKAMFIWSTCMMLIPKLVARFADTKDYVAKITLVNGRCPCNAGLSNASGGALRMDRPATNSGPRRLSRIVKDESLVVDRQRQAGHSGDPGKLKRPRRNTPRSLDCCAH